MSDICDMKVPATDDVIEAHNHIWDAYELLSPTDLEIAALLWKAHDEIGNKYEFPSDKVNAEISKWIEQA